VKADGGQAYSVPYPFKKAALMSLMHLESLPCPSYCRSDTITNITT